MSSSAFIKQYFLYPLISNFSLRPRGFIGHRLVRQIHLYLHLRVGFDGSK